jgi:hypothetical protein
MSGGVMKLTRRLERVASDLANIEAAAIAVTKQVDMANDALASLQTTITDAAAAVPSGDTLVACDDEVN